MNYTFICALCLCITPKCNFSIHNHIHFGYFLSNKKRRKRKRKKQSAERTLFMWTNSQHHVGIKSVLCVKWREKKNSWNCWTKSKTIEWYEWHQQNRKRKRTSLSKSKNTQKTYTNTKRMWKKVFEKVWKKCDEELNQTAYTKGRRL